MLCELSDKLGIVRKEHSYTCFPCEYVVMAVFTSVPWGTIDMHPCNLLSTALARACYACVYAIAMIML
jgi:hypothetical protein